MGSAFFIRTGPEPGRLDACVPRGRGVGEPDGRALAWLAGQDAGALFITAVTKAELRTGLANMPAGRRRETLGVALEAVLGEDFAGRCCPSRAGLRRHPGGPA